MALVKEVVERPARLHPEQLPNPAFSPEIYRQLYVSLNLPADSRSIIGITSAIRGEGRTTLAMGLAQTLSRDVDTQVLLVDADFGQDTIAEKFGIPVSPGLSQVIEGAAGLADVSYPITDTLRIVTGAGTDAAAPRLLREMAEQRPFPWEDDANGLIIVDLPPIITQSYGAPAAGIADAVVLVVRAGVTPVEIVQEAIARLKDRPPRGIVLNGTRSSLPSWWPDIRV